MFKKYDLVRLAADPEHTSLNSFNINLNDVGVVLKRNEKQSTTETTWWNIMFPGCTLCMAEWLADDYLEII